MSQCHSDVFSGPKEVSHQKHASLAESGGVCSGGGYGTCRVSYAERPARIANEGGCRTDVESNGCQRWSLQEEAQVRCGLGTRARAVV